MRTIALWLLFTSCTLSFNLSAMKTKNDEAKNLIKKAQKEANDLFEAVGKLFHNQKVALPRKLSETLKELEFNIALINDKQELQNIKSDIEQFIVKTLTSIKSQISVVFPWQHMSYADLEQKINANFRAVSIDPKKVYEYIGLTAQQGIKMSWQDVKKKLNQVKSKIDTTAFRQIEYAFHYNSSKAEYDAFLQGAQSFEELKRSVTTYAELQQALMLVQEYLLHLADLEDAIIRKLRK